MDRSTIWKVALGGAGPRAVVACADQTLRVADADLAHPRALAAPRVETRALGWAAGGGRVVVGTRDKAVTVLDARSGEAVATLLGLRGDVGAVALSPDGALAAGVAFLRESATTQWRVWEVATGDVLHDHDAPTNSDHLLAWRPDGAALALSTRRNNVAVVDVASGAELASYEQPRGFAAAAWSADGAALAAGSWAGAVHVWHPAGGGAAAQLRGSRARRGTPTTMDVVAWSPAGRRLAAARADGELNVWDVATGATLASSPNAGWRAASLAWCDGGARVVASSADGVARSLDVP